MRSGGTEKYVYNGMRSLRVGPFSTLSRASDQISRWLLATLSTDLGGESFAMLWMAENNECFWCVYRLASNCMVASQQRAVASRYVGAQCGELYGQ